MISENVACLCEGSAEEIILNKLLDGNKLIFTRDNLLDNRILRVRNAETFASKHLNYSFTDIISVYRIHDSPRENFKMPKAYQNKVKILDVFTKPEIEILLLLNEGKYENWTRSKNDKPSIYAKSLFPGVKIKSKEFNDSYWDCDSIIKSAELYKQKSSSSEGMVLFDLIKH